MALSLLSFTDSSTLKNKSTTAQGAANNPFKKASLLASYHYVTLNASDTLWGGT